MQFMQEMDIYPNEQTRSAPLHHKAPLWIKCMSVLQGRKSCTTDVYPEKAGTDGLS